MRSTPSKRPAPSDAARRFRASSVTRTLNLIGDVWTVLLLKESFLGTRRFQAFQERLGIPRQTLMLRLADLATHQIFYKRPVEHRTLVHEYHLTPKGLDLYPFILAVWRWHRRWNPDASFLPARLVHKTCGAALEVRLACRACGGEVTLDAVEFLPGAPTRVEPRPPARLSRQNEAALRRAVTASDPLPVATSVIGDRWSNLVLYCVFQGVRGFAGIHEALEISSNILSTRLKKLLALDLIEPVASPDRRKREYRPTRKGEDIYPMIQTLGGWGDRWLAGPEGPPGLQRHTSCGAILEARMVCAHCRQPVRAWEVAVG